MVIVVAVNKVSIGVNTDAPQLDHASQALPLDDHGGVAARVHRRRTIAVMVPTEQRTVGGRVFRSGKWNEVVLSYGQF